MLMQWLEPTIQKHIDEVYEETDNSERVVVAQRDFDTVMASLEKLMPEYADLFEKLQEATTAIRAASEDVAYRFELQDGLGLSRELAGTKIQ